MQDKEFETKPSKPVFKPPPTSSQTPTMEQLNAMKTDDLVKLLLSHDMAKPANAILRQQIIKMLQERKGNAFVQNLLGGKTNIRK
jgi:hypothetical protein